MPACCNESDLHDAINALPDPASAWWDLWSV
jgi:hypothetical protein